MALRPQVARALIVVLFLSAGARTAAQSVAYESFTPAVLMPGGGQVALFEAEITGTPTRVTFEFNPGSTQPSATVYEMRDDGTGGDRVAGDRVYAVQLPTPAIIGVMRADDVHRVFVGFLNLFNGTTNVFRGNIFIDVYTSDVGAPPITRLSQFVQTTNRLVNIHDATYFLSRDLPHVTNEFYRWFGDDYDVLNIIFAPARFANRTHFIIKNEVTGIGLARSDNTSIYGSGGRLTGISQFPIPTFFDGAETGHIHELGHQWINFLNVAPFASGVPHWPLSTMAGGVMGFSIGGTGGQGGSFSCLPTDDNGTIVLNPRSDAPVYGDLDLYLMGLLPAAEVGTQVVFVDQTAAQQLNGRCTGQAFTGAVLRATVQDVISQFGPRNPPADIAPSRFRLGTILVTRDGLASPEMMWLYSWFVERAELQAPTPTHAGFLKELGKPFYVATRGRGTLDMHLDSPAVDPGGEDFTLSVSPGTLAVNAGSPANFYMSALPKRASFDAEVRFACGPLPAHAACSFTPDRVVPGPTGKAVTLAIATKDGSQTSARAAGPQVAGILGWLILGALVLLHSEPRRLNRPASRLCQVAIVCALVGSLGCGANSPQPPSQPPSATVAVGTYSITITATSGAIQHTAVVTLSVQ